MSKPTLVVMAAGMGSRYGGLKQIDPVGPNGEIIMDYSIYDALKAGFGKIVFVIKKELAASFHEAIAGRIGEVTETAVVFQELLDVPAGFEVPPDRKKPWGTGHAVLSCRDVVQEPFAVINADDFYGRDSYRLLKEYLSGECREQRYCMVGFVLENTLTEHGHVARGICRVDDDGFLVDVHELTKIVKAGSSAQYTEDGVNWTALPENTTVSMNFWGFTPQIFRELEERFPLFLEKSRDNILKAEFFLPEVVGALVRESKASVKVFTSQERWYGVTYQEDRPFVREAVGKLIKSGRYPEKLWKDFRV